MCQVIYRKLQGHEADLLGQIDRSEQIDCFYRWVGGALLLDAGRKETVAAWSASELAEYVSRLQAVMASNGYAYGAWKGVQLVGVAALDVNGVDADRATVKLDMLYVSAGYRGRGIGRKLTALVSAQARSVGAKCLYISATPTRNTVDAYLRMGAEVLASPDPELLAKEPEDIHLLLRIG